VRYPTVIGCNEFGGTSKPRSPPTCKLSAMGVAVVNADTGKLVMDQEWSLRSSPSPSR